MWLIEGLEDGEPLEPEMALLWPAGYSFDTSSQEIFDPTGQAVASTGDRVALGGGEMPDRTPERCDVADRVWLVTSIELHD